jgi:basic membrane protein A
VNPLARRTAPLLTVLILIVGACSSGTASIKPSPVAATPSAAATTPAATATAATTPAPTATAEAPSVAPTVAPTVAPSASNLKAVYVSTGPIGVNPFLQLIGEGLQQGGTECGVGVQVIESADIATMADNLQAAIDEGNDLIVANSFDSVDQVTVLAGQNPDQKWAIVDTTVDSPNVRGMVFKEHEGTYLLGAILGLLATGNYEGFPKSDVIGEIGALDLPFIRRWSVGFEEGAKAVNPNVTFDLGWATGFNDPGTSKELAIAQNGKGAQYIFAFSAAGNTGIFEAAKDKNFFTTGVDTDQRSLDPVHIIESMVKRTDVGVHDAVCDLANGTFSGGVKAYGLAENGVGPAFLALENLDPASSLPQEVQDKVRDLADKIKSGEIVVTDYLTQPTPSASPSN